MKANVANLICKGFAGLFMATIFVLNGVFKWGYDATAIIAIGAAIASVYLPIDISKIKTAGHENE
jgi:hypothetical protein